MGVVVLLVRCQLAHLYISKTDIPSALHHQQDLDLLLTLLMCGDSWGEEKGQQVVVKCRLFNCVQEQHVLR